ncbi:MAG TPA: hypothetical protein VFB82_12980 [Blastocatellia bacterium]|nr:hypothetical protein [Blastocatellia bacterium]
MANINLFLLVLIQAQEPRRLSMVVVVTVVLVFLAGVSLLVYFFRRYKKTEKEAQDEWDRPGQSLFAAPAAALPRDQAASFEPERATISPDTIAPAKEIELSPAPALAIDPQPTMETQLPTQELKSDTTPIVAPAPVEEVPQPATQVLSSDSKQPESAEVTEAIPDDDLWAELDSAVQQRPASTQLLGVEVAPTVEPLTGAPTAIESAEPERPQPRMSQTELLGAARVDAPPSREPFEPPTITRIVHRESWEPPQIEPLKPRVQPPSTHTEPSVAKTQLLASLPPLPERSAATTDAVAPAGTSIAEIEAPIAAAAGVRPARIPAGSILGLPAERSHAPLVLGDPARSRNEVGIGALSNYGKSADSGGHAGTIALAVVVLLVGGAIAAYLLVPSVKTRANDVISRIRGIDPNPPPPIEQPKARVFPARNEAIKNTVKARGAVDNISEETLNDLEVEVSLERGNGAAPEIRKVAVKPAQLTPKQRGVFEFEYDGNRATGFSGYRIVRLVSGESEIKFSTPARTG